MCVEQSNIEKGLDQRINTVDPTSEEASWLRRRRICPQWGGRVSSPGWEDLLEEGTATPSSIRAWRSAWAEEPGRLQSMRSQRVRDN